MMRSIARAASILKAAAHAERGHDEWTGSKAQMHHRAKPGRHARSYPLHANFW